MEDRQDVEQDPGYCSSKSMSAVSRSLDGFPS